MHILALLLLRKRLVKLLERRDDGAGPVMDLLVKQDEAEETITVSAAPPSEEETAGLEQEVAKLFGAIDSE